MKKRTEPARPFDLLATARWLAEESAVFNDGPFNASVVAGYPRLLLVLGDNASGKSLMFRLIAGEAQREGVHAITLSIRERSGAGVAEMAHMRKAMIFGDEQTSSTGAISARVVETAFRQVRENPVLLGFDEPELGLSEGYAHALGALIAAEAGAAAAQLRGVVVVTHSRAVVSGLLSGTSASPSVLFAGSDISNLEQWLGHREVRSIDELRALPGIAQERFRAVREMAKA